MLHSLENIQASLCPPHIKKRNVCHRLCYRFNQIDTGHLSGSNMRVSASEGVVLIQDDPDGSEKWSKISMHDTLEIPYVHQGI